MAAVFQQPWTAEERLKLLEVYQTEIDWSRRSARMNAAFNRERPTTFFTSKTCKEEYDRLMSSPCPGHVPTANEKTTYSHKLVLDSWIEHLKKTVEENKLLEPQRELIEIRQKADLVRRLWSSRHRFSYNELERMLGAAREEDAKEEDQDKVHRVVNAYSKQLTTLLEQRRIAAKQHRAIPVHKPKPTDPPSPGSPFKSPIRSIAESIRDVCSPMRDDVSVESDVAPKIEEPPKVLSTPPRKPHVQSAVPPATLSTIATASHVVASPKIILTKEEPKRKRGRPPKGKKTDVGTPRDRSPYSAAPTDSLDASMADVSLSGGVDTVVMTPAEEESTKQETESIASEQEEKVAKEADDESTTTTSTTAPTETPRATSRLQTPPPPAAASAETPTEVKQGSTRRPVLRRNVPTPPPLPSLPPSVAAVRASTKRRHPDLDDETDASSVRSNTPVPEKRRRVETPTAPETPAATETFEPPVLPPKTDVVTPKAKPTTKPKAVVVAESGAVDALTQTEVSIQASLSSGGKERGGDTAKEMPERRGSVNRRSRRSEASTDTASVSTSTEDIAGYSDVIESDGHRSIACMTSRVEFADGDKVVVSFSSEERAHVRTVTLKDSNYKINKEEEFWSDDDDTALSKIVKKGSAASLALSSAMDESAPAERKPSKSSTTGSVGGREILVCYDTDDAFAQELLKLPGFWPDDGTNSLVPTSPSKRQRKEDKFKEDSSLKTLLMNMWRIVCGHRHSSIFSHPVNDRDAPGYSSTVKCRMDLHSLRREIETGAVSTTLALKQKLLMMFTNAIMFNSTGHDVNNYAKNMSKEIMDELRLSTCDRNLKVAFHPRRSRGGVPEEPVAARTPAATTTKVKDSPGSEGSRPQRVDLGEVGNTRKVFRRVVGEEMRRRKM